MYSIIIYLLFIVICHHVHHSISGAPQIFMYTSCKSYTYCSHSYAEKYLYPSTCFTPNRLIFLIEYHCPFVCICIYLFKCLLIELTLVTIHSYYE